MNSFSKFILGCFATFSSVFSVGVASESEYFSREKTLFHTDQEKESEVKEIVLYIKPTCPYCKKVLHALEQMDKSVQIKDISQDNQLRDELIEIGGKKQVPCIVIDGKPKYESSDIIRWLLDNQESL